MPIVKSPELLKAEALAQYGNFLSNVQNLVARAYKLTTDGVPANAQTGAPAITAAELVAVAGPDAVAFVQAAATHIAPPAPVITAPPSA
jgi:hypothetical protein